LDTNSIFSYETLKFIVPSIIAIITSVIAAVITTNNERNKIITTGFKNEGISTQKSILELWSIILIDYESFYKIAKNYFEHKIKIVNNNTDINITDLIKMLIGDTYVYSSKKTIKIASDYMQYVCSHQNNNSAMIPLYYIAKLCSSLKYDFTGEKVSYISLFKIRINNLSLQYKIKLYLINIVYNISFIGKFIIELLWKDTYEAQFCLTDGYKNMTDSLKRSLSVPNSEMNTNQDIDDVLIKGNIVDFLDKLSRNVVYVLYYLLILSKKKKFYSLIEFENFNEKKENSTINFSSVASVMSIFKTIKIVDKFEFKNPLMVKVDISDDKIFILEKWFEEYKKTEKNNLENCKIEIIDEYFNSI